MIVISVRRQSRPRSFDLVNHLEQPLAPCIGELNFPHLLSGIDDERIWNANLHLLFDKSAIGESLDDVVGADRGDAARGRLSPVVRKRGQFDLALPAAHCIEHGQFRRGSTSTQPSRKHRSPSTTT